MGVTTQFFDNPDGAYASIDQYDFAKLKQGYGLFIFSYDFRGKEGNKLFGGLNDKQKSGIRVWEYQFKTYDRDTVRVRKSMFYAYYRGPSGLFIFKSGYKFPVVTTFRKGAVVYGGRLIATNEGFQSRGPHAELQVDQDLGAWMARNKTLLEGIELDTIQISPY